MQDNQKNGYATTDGKVRPNIMQMLIEKKYRVVLVSFFISLLILSSFFYIEYLNVKSRKNFWIDGVNVGKSISEQESRVISLAEKDISRLISSFTKEERDEFESIKYKFFKHLKRSKAIYYSKVYKTIPEKLMMKKMFKRKRDFRKSLSKEERRYLLSGIRKLTLDEKIRITGGFFII